MFHQMFQFPGQGGMLLSGTEYKAPAPKRPERENGKAQIAKELGVSRTTLWRMEKKTKTS